MCRTRHLLCRAPLPLACLFAFFSCWTLPAQDASTGVSGTVLESNEVGDQEAGQKEGDKDKDGWRSLLPKEGLEGWEVTDFGTEGKVSRDKDLLVVEMGDPLNGINYTKKDFPTDNFEITLEANRVDGNDFLCGLTFPVDKEFCSFIAGGWGGGLVGLSSVDGFDASENSTTTFYEFENERWYKFKIRVDSEMIQAWIDDKEMFRLERENREFSTRIEVYSSRPLGFCTFQSKVLVRNFQWRPIKQKDATEPSVKGNAPQANDAPGSDF